MGKRYLFFVSVSYSYPILRPLQQEIWRRGDEVAWFIEQPCPILLKKGETQLQTIQEVLDYNPLAVFAPGNYIYDFFPGVKVAVFHGYPINKRGDKTDDHFTIRGWFDIYCTQGKSSTLPFKEQARKHGYFKVYETGWCKADAYFEEAQHPTPHERPVILYSSTFTKGVTSAPHLLETITSLAKKKPWDWIISFHPKLDAPEVIQQYKELAVTCPNVQFHEGGIVDIELLKRADVLLCDASSIIIEFMLLDKPVVTYRNTTPGEHLLNVENTCEIGDALERALSHPKDLMNQMRSYVTKHEAHFDGKSSFRILDAVNDYILHFKERTKSKPLNLVRKIKLRCKVKYYHW